MTKFKGTQGKWIFNEQEMKIKGSGDIEGLTVIANVSPNMDFSRGMTTQVANAKLIAAAPDLLEALESCLGLLMAEGFINGEVCQFAKIAIKKAT